MSAHTRAPWLLGLLGVCLAWAGCASKDPEAFFPGGGPGDVAPRGPCTVDEDCPDPALFFCNPATSRCEASCRTQVDCGADRRGQYALGDCDRNPLGCQCDQGKCVASLCSVDAVCGAQVCRNGRCGAPPSAEKAATCQVSPAFAIGRQGTQVRFSVAVSDAEGHPLVPAEGISWSATSAAVSGSGQGTQALFTWMSPDRSLERLEVRVGQAFCEAHLTILEATVAAQRVRVGVTDELTGRPIPEVWVGVSDETGLITASGRTDEEGVALVSASGVVSFTAFHEAYGYLTLANHDVGAGTAEVMLPLRRNPGEVHGGIRGLFQNRPTGQNLHLGFTGLSLPGMGMDAAREQRLGASREVKFELGGQARELLLPTNFSLTTPSTQGEAEYTAPGMEGDCAEDPVAASRADKAPSSSRCGTRTAWALSGDMPTAGLPPDLFGASQDTSQLLAQGIPLLRHFHSSVVRDVRFRLQPIPGASEGTPDLHDTRHYTPVDPEAMQMPLGFPFVVRVPTLPVYQGAFLKNALVVGAVDVPGRGRVPLGLGLAVNVAPSDPNTDLQSGLPAPGLVGVRMAPAHHGLEGNPYQLTVMASTHVAALEDPEGAALSAVVEPLSALTFDPKGSAPLTLSSGFLPIPEGARYNFEPVPSGDLEGRQFWFTNSAGRVGTLLRVRFTNRFGRQWTVLYEPSLENPSVRLPVPPTPFEDRTFFGDITGTRSRLWVQALAVRAPDGKRLSLALLADGRTASLAHLDEFTRAFAVLDYQRPELTWLTPDSEGRSVPRASILRVRATGFRLGTAPEGEGFVELSFRGGLGCEGLTVRGERKASLGLCEVELPLPPGCSGRDVSLTVTRVDSGGQPLRPPVASTRQVHIL
ncbi:carboxypeptidase regulatory-like domain-containing protein [Stigmatella sp. ncwal1]|uniref:Carboxypeptidase regulatory-like domain-containing protein n=1 Tax=Stigmatella ashevillensis TaxID=2995309 RepID=A0ABT5D3Y9_9BACT|nr:carboxypeptidase regulatory-like domain-containing protein [Stigmatella ashevillena]MDC0707795.1 carboxypeptidase regulatory-like domain-containing protein [Stigmatella ashevillena]